MHRDLRSRSHVRDRLALVPTTVVLLLAVGTMSGPSSTGPTPAAGWDLVTTTTTADEIAAPGPGSGAARLTLHVGDEVATATLENTAAAQRFASMLPLDVTLRDAMGQAKSGRLPQPLEVSVAERVLDPEVLGIYYWPPSGRIAIFHEDLGHLVPPPGLVRLGTVDSGLDVVTSVGSQTVRIEVS
jgi:hypothetical protein